MAFCVHCGTNVNDKAMVCVKCGCSVKNNNIHNYSSGLYALLGFIFPLIGLFVFFAMVGDRPKTAKSALQGAIANLVLCVIAVVVFIWFISNLEY